LCKSLIPSAPKSLLYVQYTSFPNGFAIWKTYNSGQVFGNYYYNCHMTNAMSIVFVMQFPL
ncbi:MAG: hypothetical protein ACK5AW_05200, partial [Pseudanabaena sp.]